MLNVNKLSFLCFFLLVGISTIGCTSLTVQEYPEEVRTGTLSSPIPETPTSSTPLSTLTFAQRDVIRKREILLEDLMAKNENCQLPCWWGVQIGDSLEDAGQRFSNLGISNWNVRTSDLSDGGLMGGIITGYYDIAERLFYLGVRMDFHADTDNNIQYVRISVSRPSPGRGKSEFIQDWQQYSLDSMLQNYGKPSQVFLRIRSVADFTPTPIYSLSLFYPDKGINITYNLDGIWLDDNQLDAEFCLNMENVNPLEIALYNPSKFEEWARYFPPYNDELYEQSTWENRMGMDLETFYQTYQDPNNSDCVQVLN